MKKSLKIIIIIFVILLILVGSFVVYTISSKNLKPLASEDFITIMENNNYSVSDVVAQYSQYDYVKEAYVASDKNFQVEFFVLSDDEHSLGFYNINKTNFEILASEYSTTTTVDIGNCSRYTLITTDKFMYVSRIGNTVIYIDVPIMYQESVQSILNIIGY